MKNTIDSVIEKLSLGWLLLNNRVKHTGINIEINGLSQLSETILDKLLLFSAQYGLIEYTCQQLIIKVPTMNNKLLEIVKEKYPDQKEYVQKLLVLS